MDQRIKFIFLMTMCLIFAGGAVSEEISSGLSGEILCIKGVQGANMVFAGTTRGFYQTVDGGKTWDRLAMPADILKIRDIAITDKNILVAVEQGVYIADLEQMLSGMIDVLWEKLPEINGVNGIAVYAEKGEDMVSFVWSGKDLFRTKGNGWELSGPGLVTGPIFDAVCCGGVVFLAAPGSVYYSKNIGRTWKKVSLYGERFEAGDKDVCEGEEDAEFSAIPTTIKNIVPDKTGGCLVVTSRGIFKVDENATSGKRIDVAGLDLRHLNYAISTERGVFAITNDRLFIYFEDGNGWRNFAGKTFPNGISVMEEHIDSSGHRWILFAGGKHFFRYGLDTKIFNSSGKDIAVDPSILDVHKMAIAYAEVNPEKIKRWRNGAQWKAIMPSLSLGFSESNDDNVEIYKSASTSYVIEGPREIDTDWKVGLTWDLSELVWNSSQTSIDVRSKLMVQLREEILEEVTRLYFERKRIISEIADLEQQIGVAGSEEASRKTILNKKTRKEELTAYIDALTGGGFSKELVKKP